MQPKNQTERNPRTAWEEAEFAGFDMSVVEANLQMTVWERIRAHSRALNLALALKEAMEKRNAGA